jgi:uncharacterized protein DUF2397
VPVSLRERGDRALRGKTSRVPDPTADRRRLIADARREAGQRRSAASELAITGALNGATVSPAARDLLLDLLGDLLTRDDAQTVDHDLGLRLTARPGPDTVITSGDGTTTVYGHRLVIEGIAAWTTVDEEAVP